MLLSNISILTAFFPYQKPAVCFIHSIVTSSPSLDINHKDRKRKNSDDTETVIVESAHPYPEATVLHYQVSLLPEVGGGESVIALLNIILY